MKTFLAAMAFALAMNWLFGGAVKADCALHEVEPGVAAVAPPSDWQEKQKTIAASRVEQRQLADVIVEQARKSTAGVTQSALVAAVRQDVQAR